MRIQVKPTRALFATQNFKVGDLKLVPLSPLVLIVFADPHHPHAASSGVSFREVCAHPTTGVSYNGYANPKVVLPKTNAPSVVAYHCVEPLAAPYWFVRETHEPALANVELADRTMKIHAEGGGGGGGGGRGNGG